ncbi:hypothetical protein Tco_0133081 [Tanacetum coccineum]
MMHPDRLRGQQRKKLRCVKVGLRFLKTTSMVTRRSKVAFGVRFCRTWRAKHKSTVVERTTWVRKNGKTVRPYPCSVLIREFYNNIMHMGPKSGAGDAYYVQRAMIHYEIDTRLPFKLRKCWEILKDHPKWQEIAIPNFNTGSEGGSKRHKSTGSSSFNTESGDLVLI